MSKMEKDLHRIADSLEAIERCVHSLDKIDMNKLKALIDSKCNELVQNGKIADANGFMWDDNVKPKRWYQFWN